MNLRDRITTLAHAAGIEGELVVHVRGFSEPGASGSVRATIGTLSYSRMTHRETREQCEECVLAHLYHEARLAAQRAALWSVVHSAEVGAGRHRDRAAKLRERAARLRAEADASEHEARLCDDALLPAGEHLAAVVAGLTDAQRAALAAVRADRELGNV